MYTVNVYTNLEFINKDSEKSAYLGNVQGNVNGNYRKKWLKHKLLSPALFSKELAENNILFSKRKMKCRNQRQQNSVY